MHRNLNKTILQIYLVRKPELGIFIIPLELISQIVTVKRCTAITLFNLHWPCISRTYLANNTVDKYMIHKWKIKEKLDESTARRHLKSPRLLSDRSLHLTFQGHGQGQILFAIEAFSSFYMLAFHFVAIKPSLAEIKQIPNLTLKIHSQGHGQSQMQWSHLRHRVQSICLLFLSWQSDHFWPRYSEFHIWPRKVKVMVMVKVKSYGHIWGSDFNRYVCFLFRGNGTIFGRDIVNSTLDLENSRSRSHPRSNLMATFEA